MSSSPEHKSEVPRNNCFIFSSKQLIQICCGFARYSLSQVSCSQGVKLARNSTSSEVSISKLPDLFLPL